MTSLKDRFHKFGLIDLSLIKLAVAAFVLFVIAVCSYVREWVESVNPWYFLIAAIIFGIKPVIKIFKG